RYHTEGFSFGSLKNKKARIEEDSLSCWQNLGDFIDPEFGDEFGEYSGGLTSEPENNLEERPDNTTSHTDLIEMPKEPSNAILSGGDVNEPLNPVITGSGLLGRAELLRMELMNRPVKKPLKPKSILQYVPQILKWRDFCQEKNTDDSIKPDKVVQFLQEKVFTRTKQLKIQYNIGYDGVIGRTEYDPAENKDEADAEAEQLKAKFHEATISGPRVKNDPGTCIFSVPIGKESVDAAIKALVFEWKHQNEGSVNFSEHPRNSRQIGAAIEG
ncbi:hypothetical protein BGZ76_006716, partial [Entomortierella beljakovae]